MDSLMQLPNPAHSTSTPLPAPHPNPPFNLAFYLIFRLELLCWIERIICRTSPLRGRKSWQAEEPILIKQHKKTLLPSVSIRRTRFFLYRDERRIGGWAKWCQGTLDDFKFMKLEWDFVLFGLVWWQRMHACSWYFVVVVVVAGSIVTDSLESY